MKVLLDIQDHKAAFILELLQSFPFLEAKTIVPSKALLLEEMSEAVQEMKAIKAGKKKSRSAEEFLNDF